MKDLKINIILLFFILIFGTGGYMFVEGSSIIDSLYMTIITITTVGFEETFPLSPVGRLFTMFLIIVGVGFVLYVFSQITESVVEGGLKKTLRRVKMEKKMAKLTDHFIVCGFGRIGNVICDILKENDTPLLVIENNSDLIQPILDRGFLVLEGEAADDDVLLSAGVKNARGLIAVASSDADNVYISLTARGINPDLYIMARSSGKSGAETKLLRSGADKVISPYFIGGTRMAQLVLRPTVVDFLDLTIGVGELGLRLEELFLSEKSTFVGKTLMDSGIRKKHDLIVVAIKRTSGEMLFNPNFNATFEAEDTLVVLGDQENIQALVEEM